ncbi:MAG: hypothetical protein ACRD12_08455 [Acidimicrobiales bacterium]
MSDPAHPVVQMVYWVDTTILPPGDRETQRPVVVIATPGRVSGTVAVVARSGTDPFGPEHPPDERLGLGSPGRFSRRHPVLGHLWSAGTVRLAGRLDDATFAAVVARFRL